MKLEFPGAVPEIPVEDLGAALVYYENNLGFTVDWSDEELGLAGISRGECRMFLSNSDYRKAFGNVGPVLIWLNLNSKDEVDELYRLWSGRNADLLSEPESMPDPFRAPSRFPEYGSPKQIKYSAFTSGLVSTQYLRRVW